MTRPCFPWVVSEQNAGKGNDTQEIGLVNLMLLVVLNSQKLPNLNRCNTHLSVSHSTVCHRNSISYLIILICYLKLQSGEHATYFHFRETAIEDNIYT